MAATLQVIITGDSTGLKVALNQGTTAAKGFESSVGGVGKTASSALGKLVPLGAAAGGAAIALFAKQSFDAALQFDKSMTQIATLTDAPIESMGAMKDSIMALSGETAQSPVELAQAMYFLASAGLDAEQQMQTLEASAKGAAVGLGAAGDLAKITANALNVFADNGLQATDVIDTLVAAVREGSAEPDEFADALGRVLPIADKAGISFQQVAASLATMSNAGLDVNEGVTALRGTLQSLVAPTDKTVDTLGSLGLTVDDVVSNLSQHGLIDTLRMLDKTARANTDSTGEYNITMRELVPNVRALTGVFNLTTQQAEKVDEIFKEVTDSTGDLQLAWIGLQESAAFKFKKALQDIQNVGQEVATAVLPLLAEAFENVAGTAKGAATAIESAKDALDLLPHGAEDTSSALDGATDSTKSMLDAATGLFTFNMQKSIDGWSNSWHSFTDSLTHANEEAFVGAQVYTALGDTASREGAAVEEAAKKTHEAADAQKALTDESANLFTKFNQLSTVGVDVNSFLSDFKTNLEESDDPLKTVGEAVADLQSQMADWRDEAAASLTGVGDVLSGLADKAHLSAGDVQKAFEDAADDARAFTADLVTIGQTGGQAGKDLASALLQMGPSAAGLADTIAGSSDEMRKANVKAFGDILDAGQGGAAKLEDVLVPVLTSIRDVLIKIARKWGVVIHLDDNGAVKKVSDIESGLAALPEKKVIEIIMHSKAKSPWPDEALEQHLWRPLAQHGVKQINGKYTVPIDIAVHTTAADRVGFGNVRAGLQGAFGASEDELQKAGRHTDLQKLLQQIKVQAFNTGELNLQHLTAILRSTNMTHKELRKWHHDARVAYLAGLEEEKKPPAWIKHATTHNPALPFGPTNINPREHGGPHHKRRAPVVLDRRHFDEGLAYERDYSGFNA